MSYLQIALSQQLAPSELPAAVRTALGKPLRRAAPLTQLALIGALACLPAERRSLPTALLWQSTRGPRQETRILLDEICDGAAEPMPYDFLATQPAVAAAQIQPFIPGLQSASHFPLDTPGIADWSLLLALAANWLAEGRYAQVLCAHLDHSETAAGGHWISLGKVPLENMPVRLQIGMTARTNAVPDTPDFPAHLARWLAQGDEAPLPLQSSATGRLAVEFARP